MRVRFPSVMLVLAGCTLAMGCVTTVHHEPVYTPAVTAAPVGAEGEPFYDELSPYGEWVNVSGPGWVWVPYGTPAGWRPYRLGHWVYTDYGWTWASDETYGHVVYHYGRWYSDPAYGWVWVPGTDWGPAWVAWNEGGGYVGWAPLPWQVTWRAGIGLDWGGVNIQVALGPSYWHFVPTRYLVAPTLSMYYVAPSRNVTLIRTTQHVTNYIYVNNRIVDHGVKADKVGRAVGHTIPRYRVRPAAPKERGRGGGYVDGDEFIVERPAANRGVRARGNPNPPGEARSNRPGNRGREVGSPPPAPEETSSGAEATDSRPARDRYESHPSRYSRRPRPEAPAPYPPVADPASAPAVEPGPGERPVPPGRARRENPSTPDQSGGNPPAERPGNGRGPEQRNEPGNPGRSGGPNQAGTETGQQAAPPPSRGAGQETGRAGAGPEQGRPAPANANPPSAAPSKQPAGKSKGKGNAGAKPGKGKPAPPSPESTDPEKQKPEEKESGDGK